MSFVFFSLIPPQRSHFHNHHEKIVSIRVFKVGVITRFFFFPSELDLECCPLTPSPASSIWYLSSCRGKSSQLPHTLNLQLGEGWVEIGQEGHFGLLFARQIFQHTFCSSKAISNLRRENSDLLATLFQVSTFSSCLSFLWNKNTCGSFPWLQHFLIAWLRKVT